MNLKTKENLFWRCLLIETMSCGSVVWFGLVSCWWESERVVSCQVIFIYIYIYKYNQHHLSTNMLLIMSVACFLCLTSSWFVGVNGWSRSPTLRSVRGGTRIAQWATTIESTTVDQPFQSWNTLNNSTTAGFVNPKFLKVFSSAIRPFPPRKKKGPTQPNTWRKNLPRKLKRRLKNIDSVGLTETILTPEIDGKLMLTGVKFITMC
jgi:hypothetical protein